MRKDAALPSTLHSCFFYGPEEEQRGMWYSQIEQQKTGEPRRGSWAVIRTKARHPYLGSHHPTSGGPRDPSRVMDPHTSRGKAHRGETEPLGLMGYNTKPTTGRGLDDESWIGPSS
uniref:Uncharacterized protein n=1 Tax=Solanum tuberosum TaxID=4113 RepID=M1DX62_SOLTU